MDDVDYVYSAFITLKNGKRLYAHEVGLTVFRFKPRMKKNDQRKKR